MPDSLLPWKPIAPSSCSRFSLWAIFGLGPLPPPFDAAASRVSGKTVTETFPTPADCRKAQQEVSEFHRFQLLSQELIALNEKICALRPAQQTQGAGQPRKKTAAAIHQELAREIATLPRPYLRRAAQSRPDRSRGHRDGTPGWLAPPGNGGFDRIAARRHSARRTAAAPLPLRPEGPLR